MAGAFGNLWRWTIYGLAILLLFAIYLNVTAENGVETADTQTTAEPETTPAEMDDTAPTDVADAGAEPEANVEIVAEDTVRSAEEELTEAAENAEATARESAEAAAAEARDEVEQGMAAVTDEVQEAADDVAEAVADVLPSDVTETEEAVETEALSDEAVADADQPGPEPTLAQEGGAEGSLPDEDEASPPTFGELTVPGDEATYELVSAFRRDDGAIEVTTARTNADGETTQTTRLITCAPLAAGVISEGDGPRNDAPELERIVLGNATATIAAAACGALR